MPRGDEAAVVRRLRAAGCVFAQDEAALLLADGRDVEGLLVRRAAGEPLEQVLGWAQFGSLRVLVEPGVFVPRRRTQLLAREAVRWARPGAAVVDLCCGSGAVGLAVATAVPGVVLHAVDIDPAALHCARRNLAAVGGVVHLGDLLAALPEQLRGQVDVLAANAPYVPTAAVGLMPREARDHEPTVTLDGGHDGVQVHRRIAAAAAGWLAADGVLLLETSANQAPRTAAAVTTAGLVAQVVHDDDLDGTVVLGRASPRHA